MVYMYEVCTPRTKTYAASVFLYEFIRNNTP